MVIAAILEAPVINKILAHLSLLARAPTRAHVCGQALHRALGGRHGGVVGLALHGPAAAVLSPTRSHGAPMEIVAQG